MIPVWASGQVAWPGESDFMFLASNLPSKLTQNQAFTCECMRTSVYKLNVAVKLHSYTFLHMKKSYTEL